MLSKTEIAQVLERALKEKGDFAELYFEDTEETQISTKEKVVNEVKSVQTFGAGLYLLNGTDSIYVYSNDIAIDALLKMAENASDLMVAKKRNMPAKNIFLRSPGDNLFDNLDAQEVKYKKIIKMIHEADMAVRNSSKDINQLDLHYFGSRQKIRVANSDGLMIDDVRISTRMRYAATASNGVTNYSRWEDLYKEGDFDKFVSHDDHVSFAKDFVNRMVTTMSAKPIKQCKVPVVLEAGVAGTLFHECCGHMLEGCAIASKRSPFVGKIGERVGSEKVTLIDDGTALDALGTSKIDDEGHLRQKNILIEKGVLKSYMNDRLSSRILGMDENGCGRRQNYMYAPTSRMSNTYLQPGADDENEMISDIDEGLYVKTVGGGVGGAQFAIAVADGFWIEKGQITYPVKGVSITGNGIDVMQKIDRVGKKLGKFEGSFCGAASGLIPTTVNQPRIRISEMSIG